MIFEFVPPLLHDADGRQCGGIAERAESAAQHVLGKFADHVDVFGAAKPGMEALEHFAEPGGSFAARDAPAAGFMRVKMHDPARHIDHAGVFIHHDHAAGAEHRAGFGDGVVIHGQINFVGGEDRARTAAGNHRFEFFAVGNAAGHFVDELFHVHAERNFVDAGLIDVAGNAEQARAAVSRRAAIGVSFAAFVDDARHGAERFHVVDDGGAAVEPDDGREGRLDARIAALAFKRFHQSGFFATFVGAGAGVNQKIVIETGIENVFAEVAALIRLADGFFHEVENVAIFAANINEAAIGADGAARNDHAFDQLVRVHFHQRPILARARLGFIRVADDVFRFRRIFWHERPLHAGGEARAAASAKAGLFYFVDDGFRRHLLERFFERTVAAVFQIDVDLAGILDAPARADERRFKGIAIVQRAANHRLGGGLFAFVEVFENAIEFQDGEIFVEVVIHLHGGCAGASADTFDLFERKHAIFRGLFVADFEALFGALQNVVAAAKHASDVRANLHVVLAQRFAAKHGIVGERFFDLHGVKFEAPRYFRDHLVADEAELVLRVHHHRDERAALHRICVLQLFEFRRELRRHFHGR